MRTLLKKKLPYTYSEVRCPGYLWTGTKWCGESKGNHNYFGPKAKHRICNVATLYSENELNSCLIKARRCLAIHNDPQFIFVNKFQYRLMSMKKRRFRFTQFRFIEAKRKKIY